MEGGPGGVRAPYAPRTNRRPRVLKITEPAASSTCASASGDRSSDSRFRNAGKAS